MISRLDRLQGRDIYENTALAKLNEVIDAVNSIVSVQEKLIDSRFVVETKHKEPADPYAEQRRYICKLCWFWNDDKADKVIGILTGVFDEADRPFERNIDQTLYKHCEPVKPDDDIIYKGNKMQLDFITTTYLTDGHIKEYHGQNGASIVTDHPLPAGYVIKIREPETKGGDK